MNTSNDLIFDIGTHNGEDARFYMHKGYRVIAIDANPEIIELNKAAFAQEAVAGKVTFLNYAIGATSGAEIEIYTNADSAQSSVFERAGGRNGAAQKVYKVETKSLDDLFGVYGIPYYCKIDIEGYDSIAISGISPDRKPRYISAESECTPLYDDPHDESKVLDVLNALHQKGYLKFKLVDQTTLRALGLNDFYARRTGLTHKMRRAVEKRLKNYSPEVSHHEWLAKKIAYPLVYDSSGPFGKDLEGEGAWVDYEGAKQLYLHNRRQLFKLSKQPSMWADWHATF